MASSLLIALALICAAAPSPLLAQNASDLGVQPSERPAIKFVRYEEDWSPLADPDLRTEPLDPLKYIDLGGGGWLTLGGELRLRYEGYSRPRFGFALPVGPAVPDHDDYLLTRSTIHADLHVGSAVRAFVQVGAYRSFGEELPAAPLNANKIDLAQAFVDVTGKVGRANLLARAGRQEVAFGSQRLIGVREGPNTRLAFDGVRFGASLGAVRLDAFALRPVAAAYGSFDDRSSSRSEFVGFYATILLAPRTTLDAYAITLTRPVSRFADAAGNERRRTVGARFAGSSGGWDWDLEAAYQFGTVGVRRISAYTLANDVGYSLQSVPWTPRLFFRADIASGDRSPGGKLGTFEAPFPKLPYLTEAGALFAPQNLMDLHPGLSARPTRELMLTAEYAAIWKHRRADFFYLPPGLPQSGTAGGPRFSAHLAQAEANWTITPQLAVGAGYAHAFAGAGLHSSGGGDTDFVVLNLASKF